ncbi:MAG: hypothetical protein ACRYFS_15460 [Janthinobacterium lividum]
MHQDLGLIGAVLPVGAFQTLEGARRLAPIFEVVQNHGKPIYLHIGSASPEVPGQTVLDTPPDDAPALRAVLERSTSFALGALTQTGFLAPYPDVMVQIAMLGGSNAFYATWAKLHGGRDKGPVLPQLGGAFAFRDARRRTRRSGECGNRRGRRTESPVRRCSASRGAATSWRERSIRRRLGRGTWRPWLRREWTCGNVQPVI